MPLLIKSDHAIHGWALMYLLVYVGKLQLIFKLFFITMFLVQVNFLLNRKQTQFLAVMLVDNLSSLIFNEQALDSYFLKYYFLCL